MVNEHALIGATSACSSDRSVAQAKTGTGKTIAFLLPLLQRMIQEDPSLASRKTARNARSDDIRGIVLSPTRELAEQIAEEARRLTRHTGLVVQSAVGGTRRDAMLRQTQRQGCHLLVATPGRLCDLLQDSSSGIDAPNLAAMVLDEADRMLDVGFEQELADINRCLPSASEKTRQTMLVSATIPNEVIRLARNLVRADDFEFVQTIPEHESLTHDHVPQHLVPLTSWNNVFPALFELIDREIVKSLEDRELSPFKAIVYFNTTALVELASELGYQRRRAGGLKTPTFAIQSKLSQNSRSKAAEMFRKARSAVLFSSDVTARGMDFPDVTHVIQIDNPRDYESYIHRLGRTARQNKKGEGWLFVPPMAMRAVKKQFRNLPLKLDQTLKTHDAEADPENPSQYQRQVRDLMQSVPRPLLVAAYTSIFGGQREDREALVDDLNTWATTGWGWSEPPTVSHSWARNQGLLHANLNIGDGIQRDGNRYDRNDSFRGRGSRDSDSQQSSDPFTEMGRQARRDGPSSGSRHGYGRRMRDSGHRSGSDRGSSRWGGSRRSS